MPYIQHTEIITELVHEKSIEILSQTGFCVPENDVLKRLSAMGFPVDWDTQMVRITNEILETALSTLPNNISIYDRNGQNPAPFDNGSRFMGAGTPVHVLDLDNGSKRPSTLRDVRNLVTIQDASDQIDIVRPTVTATDMGASSDIVEIAELIRFTSKPIVHRTLSPENVDVAMEMLAAVAGGLDAFRSRPNFATLYCPISPGYFTPENVRCMIKWAEYGVPITILSMAMGGASAPVTLLGELIVINTDILAWIAVLQMLHPGTPLIYGSVSSVLDMRTGILPLGAPERGMVNSGAAIMGKHYGIPSMCGGLSSDAKEVDAQAGFEKAITALPLLLEDASIIYGAGAMYAGSAISFTQMVLDDEIIGGLRRLTDGIALHDVEEEVVLIKSNTPRGNFLNKKHTRQNYNVHWHPSLLNRETFDTWLAKGQTIEQICQNKAADIVANHSPDPLPAHIEAELEKIIRRNISQNYYYES